MDFSPIAAFYNTNKFEQRQYVSARIQLGAEASLTENSLPSKPKPFCNKLSIASFAHALTMLEYSRLPALATLPEARTW
jgi:hypothetical protein